MNWRVALEIYVYVMAVVFSGIGLAMLDCNDHPYLALGLLPLAVGLCVFAAIRMSELD